jgi:hypothetical protein
MATRGFPPEGRNQRDPRGYRPELGADLVDHAAEGWPPPGGHDHPDLYGQQELRGAQRENGSDRIFRRRPSTAESKKSTTSTFPASE